MLSYPFFGSILSSIFLQWAAFWILGTAYGYPLKRLLIFWSFESLAGIAHRWFFLREHGMACSHKYRSWTFIITHPLHLEMEEGETRQCQTLSEEKHISYYRSPFEISYTVSTNLLKCTSMAGYIFSVVFLFWLSFQLYSVMLLIKEYPSSVSLRRYLLCLCNFWIQKAFFSLIESTCSKITSFILLTPSLL